MRSFALALVFLASAALAQEPRWLLVAPQRVVAGERFEVIVVAPADEAPPEELTLRAQMDVVELLIPARALGEPQGARRRYTAIMPSRAGGPATLSLSGYDSNAIAVVTSKNVGVTASVPSDCSRSTMASTSSAVCWSVAASTCACPMTNRSDKSTRCGET